jgi:DNA-binding PadR family transcriptional regulator
VRGLLLAALLDGPAHGYELMRRLEGQAGGRWRPSPGSVYPLLQLLEDEGLVRGRDSEGRKVFELTERGRAQADAGQLRDLTAEPRPGPRTWTCAPRCTGCTAQPGRSRRPATPLSCRRQ